VKAPTEPEASSVEQIIRAGDQFWPLRVSRELDDVLLRMRVNEPEIGTIMMRTEGDRAAVLAVDKTVGRGRKLARPIVDGGFELAGRIHSVDEAPVGRAFSFATAPSIASFQC
jgi:hypothetical protein